MSLIKRERRPSWPVDTMWSEDWFDQAFRDMFRDFLSSEGQLGKAFEGMSNLMRVEEFVEGSTCVIRAELPGIDPEKDVEISVSDGIMHLQAVRRERSEDERPDGYRSEFRYGSLERRFRLPQGTTEKDIKATYHDGILEVRVPAPKQVKPAAKIPIARS
jgi:HSP20 family protein